MITYWELSIGVYYVSCIFYLKVNSCLICTSFPVIITSFFFLLKIYFSITALFSLCLQKSSDSRAWRNATIITNYVYNENFSSEYMFAYVYLLKYLHKHLINVIILIIK